MALKLSLLILISALITAFISGLFGMAGGMIFMGVIASFMGVSEAMIVHGFVQSISNGFRSYLIRENIRWDILGYTFLGALPTTLIVVILAFVPPKPVLYFALGLLPLLLWLPRDLLQGDAAKPKHAMLCGAAVMGLNLLAGIAGPALDFFYVKTALTRQEIVATKAVTMLASHSVKIFVFGIPLIRTVGTATLPPVWLIAGVMFAVIPCVFLGTFLGTRLLYRFSDIGFKRYTRLLVTIVGGIYIWRGFVLMGFM